MRMAQKMLNLENSDLIAGYQEGDCIMGCGRRAEFLATNGEPLCRVCFKINGEAIVRT